MRVRNRSDVLVFVVRGLLLVQCTTGLAFRGAFNSRSMMHCTASTSNNRLVVANASKRRADISLLLLHSSSSSASNGGTNVDADIAPDDDVVDMYDISDGEALLACRSFLQRKNLLGWKRGAERKELRKASRGFFWETPEQQQYWSKREEEDIDFNQGSANDDGGCPESSDSLLSDEETTPAPTGLFTSMPTGPNERSEVRRRVKIQQWNDPAFRERWYEARWGHDYVPQTDVAKNQQRLQRKLQTMPDSILESSEFALMSPEEIEEAILTYVVSNRKRSRSRSNQALERQQRKQESVSLQEDGTITKSINVIDDAPPLDRDALFSMSDQALREKQKQRSERAKKAYDTRLSNAAAAKQKSPKASEKQSWKPLGNTPKDALIRIGADLDADRMPLLSDIESIMEAKKLSRRKDVLLRILKEQFQLRGKCIERESDDDASTEIMYMTQASIAQIGAFLIRLMKAT
jgi:hypothetical protein